jgi:hypothetical protein
MGSVIQKRMSGKMEGDFVVFLIGMRVNRWWRLFRWLRVARSMSRMLRELDAHPELGYLGGEAWVGRTTVMVSYWRSTEHLIEYARRRGSEHLPAWQAFNKQVGTNGDIGIWHETYRVHPGDYEAVYVNMPAFGVGKAGALVEATGGREHAAGRLAASAASHG